jgi:hypothetical protein
MQSINEQTMSKWQPVLEHPDLPQIKDTHKRSVVAQLLENTERSIKETNSWSPGTGLLAESAPVNSGYATSSGSYQGYDPVLISLVRRAMPNLVAYDVCGVQPMTGPTGLIFAMRSQTVADDGTTRAETFYNEVNTRKSGDNSEQSLGGNTSIFGDVQAGGFPDANSTGGLTSDLYNFRGGMTTAQGEALGDSSSNEIAQMAFSIEKVAVTAKTRALRAEYSMELAQDLKAIHGLDAETELANILSSEILAEINREVIRTINGTAKRGAETDTTVPGIFDLDTDSNGRWSVEKFKGLMFQLEREANKIAKDTRRGKGNIVICSSDVASALQMAGVLDYAPALNSNNLNPDDTGNTFAGVLNGRMRVYIDPYASGNYITVGYKGSSAFDAGLFYCPYVPLQMVRAVGEQTFQPKIGFKTRYGMQANPFAKGASASVSGITGMGENVYYRNIEVANLM